ncbi:PDEase domain-containing protein [Trichonephila clavipes]|nr:PDEase domain-containing protein [Trichonephila clavipes]
MINEKNNVIVVKVWGASYYIFTLTLHFGIERGDKELSFGIITPDHMLRTNAENIPKYQTAFMENVVLPIYQLLTKVFPQLREILKTAQ